nr:MAG TPA: hypothetical protein [Bacteriophage sp.]
MTPFELEAVFDGWESARELRLWETSYFTSAILNTQTRKPVKPKKLMEPFLNKKSASVSDDLSLREQLKRAREIAQENKRKEDE